MDLIAYWNVVKRRQRIVVIGLCITTALAFASMVKPTASGISWRTPPVYDATTTLLVTQPGFPEGRVGDPSTDPRHSWQLALFYSRLAGSDFIERPSVGSSRSRSRSTTQCHSQERWPTAPAPPDPCVRVVARGSGRARERCFNALTNYLAREQASNRITGEDRVELTVSEKRRKPRCSRASV